MVPSKRPSEDLKISAINRIAASSDVVSRWHRSSVFWRVGFVAGVSPLNSPQSSTLGHP